MTTRPEYFQHALLPGKPMFACERLSASMTTDACATRWKMAEAGSSCASCSIGRLHATGTEQVPTTAPPRRKRQSSKSGACPRCGGSGLRLLVCSGLCVSCANREYEFIKGRNAKGKVPIEYRPPHSIEVGVELADGAIEIREVDALHGAEAIARVARDLPDGARFVDAPRPGPTTWNATTKTFECQCRRCRTTGLVLERVRKGVLERRCWSCDPDMDVNGWTLSPVRQPLLGLYPDAQVELMAGDPDLCDEMTGAWTALPAWCAGCRRGQLQGLLTAPGGRWRVRCDSCGSDSAEAIVIEPEDHSRQQSDE